MGSMRVGMPDNSTLLFKKLKKSIALIFHGIISTKNFDRIGAMGFNFGAKTI